MLAWLKERLQVICAALEILLDLDSMREVVSIVFIGYSVIAGC